MLQRIFPGTVMKMFMLKYKQHKQTAKQTTGVGVGTNTDFLYTIFGNEQQLTKDLMSKY